MQDVEQPTIVRRIRNVVIGTARKPTDKTMFHKLSLVAFLAWVGLGADGLSSACYGPSTAFTELIHTPHLAIFVALASAVTIFVISSSYSQLIELFPAGGGGYVVASKLLSPKVGMVAGCALLVDYVLTISVSISDGTTHLFETLPGGWSQYRVVVAIVGIAVLTLLNMRGVRESVGPLVPIFLVFLVTHLFVICYAVLANLGRFEAMWAGLLGDIGVFTGPGPAAGGSVAPDLGADAVLPALQGTGVVAMVLIVMHAYTSGAGTFTGIEAVSNGLPLLREPRVQTGKRAMTYMWISLAVMAVGLMLAYIIYQVKPDPSRPHASLTALMLEQMTAGWGTSGKVFVTVTLLSETALLFVAAQAGFLGGPRMLAYMASDRWMPSRLSMLSDRLVTQNGVLLMAGAAIATMYFTQADTTYLLVLYSINVFITFLLSQSGMVKHWWVNRRRLPGWGKKFLIAGIGTLLTLLILIWVVAAKFFRGGWVTLIVTGSLIVIVLLIRRHYNHVGEMLKRLNKLAEAAEQTARQLDQINDHAATAPLKPDPTAKTAVLLVNGFNGFGMHTLLNVLKMFGESFRNFVFVQVGMVDAGNFKGASEVDKLEKHIQEQVHRYVDFVRKHGYYAEGVTVMGTDVVEEMAQIAPRIADKHSQVVFFAGQLVLPQDNFFTRLLHNYVTFSVQRRLYRQGLPFVILPIRV